MWSPALAVGPGTASAGRAWGAGSAAGCPVPLVSLSRSAKTVRALVSVVMRCSLLALLCLTWFDNSEVSAVTPGGGADVHTLAAYVRAVRDECGGPQLRVESKKMELPRRSVL